MGQDNDFVYRELPGVGEAEFVRLVDSGQLASEFDQSIR